MRTIARAAAQTTFFGLALLVSCSAIPAAGTLNARVMTPDKSAPKVTLSLGMREAAPAQDARPRANCLRILIRVQRSASDPGQQPVGVDVFDWEERPVQSVRLAPGETQHREWSKVIVGNTYILRPSKTEKGRGLATVLVVLTDTETIDTESYQNQGPKWTPVYRLPASSVERQLSQSVARINTVKANGVAYGCTGFLIKTNTLVTNAHCVESESECQSTYVMFDDDKGDPAPDAQIKCITVEPHPHEDLTLLHIARSPVNARLFQMRADVLSPGDHLRILEHPWRRRLLMSAEGCQVDAVGVNGGLAAPDTDVAYGCDTVDSASGSPVLNDANMVIAIHHLQIPNRGVGAKTALSILH
jgi:hypothetical protein